MNAAVAESEQRWQGKEQELQSQISELQSELSRQQSQVGVLPAARHCCAHLSGKGGNIYSLSTFRMVFSTAVMNNIEILLE